MRRRRPTPADHDTPSGSCGAPSPTTGRPGEVLFELAVDAVDLSEASRADPIDYEGLRQRYLPEISFTGKTSQLKSRHLLHAVAARRGGLQPDLLDDVGWWRNDDFWVWAHYALVIYVRAAADRTGQSTADICTQLAGDPTTRPNARDRRSPGSLRTGHGAPSRGRGNFQRSA
jgi:hypothetical protein